MKTSNAAAEQHLRQHLIGKFLKSARESAGLTQYALATRLSYSSAQFISNWERGMALPPLDVLPRIAKILKIAPKDLVEVLYEYQDELLKLQKKQLREIFRKTFRKVQ